MGSKCLVSLFVVALSSLTAALGGTNHEYNHVLYVKAEEELNPAQTSIKEHVWLPKIMLEDMKRAGIEAVVGGSVRTSSKHRATRRHRGTHLACPRKEMLVVDVVVQVPTKCTCAAIRPHPKYMPHPMGV
ncbi:hypothetical protein SeMB42_g06714 [Synchytrium endobioticum]|uniref:Uncharacterized protein n=1 Tax=Synchytrium endobioticum TaxID=286115 RepID=A0A507CGC9_9FUNG|nr:hypothetical protein SeMB42_g06714 [Synchytrium endobioticum]TPX39295.1 hypothetical protein SeLEV6574_g07316 [Synchytrium endobioticum]